MQPSRQSLAELTAVSADRARSRLIGILLLVVSACLFGCVDGVSKVLTAHATAGQIVWARYALALPVLLIGAGPSRLGLLFSTTRPKLQLLRGISPMGVSFGMTIAVATMPLAEATVILFAAPLLVVALSAPLLGERVTASRWAAVAVGFAAVLIVARPGFGHLSHYALFPLMAAVFYALMQLITRRVASLGERPETTLAWTLATGAVVSSPVAFAMWQPLALEVWGQMIFLGLLFGVAQLIMIRGFAHAPAALLAPLSYVQIISATVFGVAVFGQTPDIWTFVGIALILASGLYVVRQRGG